MAPAQAGINQMIGSKMLIDLFCPNKAHSRENFWNGKTNRLFPINVRMNYLKKIVQLFQRHALGILLCSAVNYPRHEFVNYSNTELDLRPGMMIRHVDPVIHE